MRMRNHADVLETVSNATHDKNLISDTQAMMWGDPDLADTEVDSGNDAEFGIIAISCCSVN